MPGGRGAEGMRAASPNGAADASAAFARLHGGRRARRGGLTVGPALHATVCEQSSSVTSGPTLALSWSLPEQRGRFPRCKRPQPASRCPSGSGDSTDGRSAQRPPRGRVPDRSGAVDEASTCVAANAERYALKVLKLKRARINARFLINKRRLGGPRPSCHPLAPVPSPFRGASVSRGVTATGAVLPAST